MENILDNEASKTPGLLDRWVRSAVLGRLRSVECGRVLVVDETDGTRVGCGPEDAPLEATVTVRDPSFYSDIAYLGAIGAAESYMEGRWSTDDLTALETAAPPAAPSRTLPRGRIDARVRHL